MNKLKKLMILSCIALVFAGCVNKNTTTETQVERIEPVETLVLHKSEIARVLDFNTTLQGYETMNVAPAMTGRIEHIYVEVGSRVKKGDNLVRMDQNQIRTAKLALSNLEIEFERVEALHKLGSISQQIYDQTKLQLEQTRENVAFLEQNTYVKAPFSGVITMKNYEDGELYSGQPILVLTQINVLKAFVNIPETYYPLVKNGMSVDVRSTIYPDNVFSAKIEMVYPTIDASSHTFQVKLMISNPNETLRPGMYATSTISMGEIESVIAPYQAVLKMQGANERYVFLNNKGVAKRVVVTLGQRFDDKIEIISDQIQEGSELIVVGQSRLVDGIKLNIVNKK
ncbi:efflux RND transporter periplasmic adaptor subunit [Odoribacter sp. OttesenSCG-928-L07]|nr:efflux RND transporter periplasmic adaptor subunit [Odoribacter sp. OttesenSCG-928-L07]MDL2239468.1 efflux RND transporter periplasmic adaptor subunit [Bacteroidales bacterium OttesenSCG-928-L14]MDL2240687.1 efflux RND transporter periplasmic adaptor subunit [Bacteroidales bacterium OttesenSCG-928-K22]